MSSQRGAGAGRRGGGGLGAGNPAKVLKMKKSEGPRQLWSRHRLPFDDGLRLPHGSCGQPMAFGG